MKLKIQFIAILLLIVGSLQAQTKRIYNGNLANTSTAFIWTSLDNLGMVIDYDKIKNVDLTRGKVDTTLVIKKDSTIGTTEDTTTVKHIDKQPVIKMKKGQNQRKVKRKKKRAKQQEKAQSAVNSSNLQKAHLAKNETQTLPLILTSKQTEAQQSNKSFVLGWFMLLLIPALFLFKSKSLSKVVRKF
ncbi:MAG: hypothetical protein ACI8ZN_001712 [Bacteroidia bacterium]|jgi:hypothetical protein